MKNLDKNICYNCTEDLFLQEEIKKDGIVKTCDYCNEIEVKSYSINQLACRFNAIFRNHFQKSINQWELNGIRMDNESSPEGEQIVEAIINVVKITENIALALHQVLEDTYSSEDFDYNYDSYYIPKQITDIEWEQEWNDFIHCSKTRFRFVNKKSREMLNSLFTGISDLQDKLNIDIIKNIGPDTDFTEVFRARTFESDEKLKIALKSPHQELGPPPSFFASAGRMNAYGISVFYGASEQETAISEIRPPVGSTVAIAKFNIIRILEVLDLDALSSIKLNDLQGSFFDNDFAKLQTKALFLKKLNKIMTKPVLPNEENFEYLPTQIIADYLASEMKLDGLIFSSAQHKKGLNLVLFNHASKVQVIEFHNGTSNVRIMRSSDNYHIISCILEVPIGENSALISTVNDDETFNRLENSDSRIPSLSIDTQSIALRSINEVLIKSEEIRLDYFDPEKKICPLVADLFFGNNEN